MMAVYCYKEYNLTQYPVELLATPLPLPEAVDQSGLNRHGLFAVQGINTELAEQLVESSRQPQIVEYCPNDSASRFGDVDMVAAWQARGRLALPLVRRAGDGALVLAGFGWMGPAQPKDDEPDIAGAQTAFAIRIYKDAVGQGNALPYTKVILDSNGELYGNRGVWLGTWGDNVAAIKIYERAGFEKVAEATGSRHGKKVPRVYMTLGNIAGA